MSFVFERGFNLTDPLWGGSGEDSESALSGVFPCPYNFTSSSDEWPFKNVSIVSVHGLCHFDL